LNSLFQVQRYNFNVQVAGSSFEVQSFGVSDQGFGVWVLEVGVGFFFLGQR
jgi:hypothetical protein